MKSSPCLLRGNRRKGAGGPEWSRNRPRPSSFWGRSQARPVSGRGRYRSTNSRPAWRWSVASASGPTGTLEPAPLPLDDAAQRPTAGGAAKPLAGAASGGREVRFATGPIAAKKSGFVGWALTLARRRRGARRVRRGGELSLVGRGASPLGTATA